MGDPMNNLEDAPLALLQATYVEIIDELLRRGLSIDEICRRSGVSNADELWALVGRDSGSQ